MGGSMLQRYKYDVALSFAGEQRDYVEAVWKGLIRNGLSVFYDEDPKVQATHLGERFSELAQNVYGTGAEFVVMFLSREYNDKIWPVLEASLISDRMRDRRFVNTGVFIVKFDETHIRGIPNDIWYTSANKQSADQYVETLLEAISARRKINQEQILAHFAREEFEGVIKSLLEALKGELSHSDRIFATYSLACAETRLSERCPDESDTLLDRAAEHLEECVGLSEGEVRSQLTAFANKDDDLLTLRTANPARIQAMLGVEVINLTRTGRSYEDVGSGCVDPASLISVPGGSVPMRDLEVGSYVSSLSPHSFEHVRPAAVLKKRTFDGEPRLSINQNITVSTTQPLFSKERGWILARDIKAGMHLLKSDGSYEIVSATKDVGAGTVMIIAVDDPSHTFVANGFVCHNIGKVT
jgi:hypothetical protein